MISPPRRSLYYTLKIWLIIICMVLLFVSTFFVYFMDQRVLPILKNFTETEMSIIASDSINQTLNENLIPSIEYDDIVEFVTDDEGRIILAKPDTLKLSKLQSESALVVQKALDAALPSTIEVPFGVIFNNTLFSIVGPKIPVGIMPLGNANVYLKSSFEDGGINQTKHLLYLEVTINIRIHIPFLDSNVSTVTHFPLSEYIIVGEVPNYVGFPTEFS